MDRSPAPPLLPVLRSQQQAEILALVLGDPDLELSLTELAERTGVPYASVHREIERAEATGLVTTRRVGRTRLVRANPASPYFAGLSDVLTKAFGIPNVLAAALNDIDGIDRAVVFGSWAARFHGKSGPRPVADIDVLILGSPNRDALYDAVASVERRVGRPVQVTVRAADWFERGTGSFHGTLTSRPVVDVPLARDAPP